MADKVPGTLLNAKVDDLVEEWTGKDFNAAGERINGTLESPAKIAGVKAFAGSDACPEKLSFRVKIEFRGQVSCGLEIRTLMTCPGQVIALNPQP